MLGHDEAHSEPRLDTQIHDLARSLNQLYRENRVVQARLDGYKYPVLTLPTEIVSAVFVHFLPPYPPPFTGDQSPTCLTNICRRWRQIALETPELWRAIRFCVGKDSESFERERHIADIWLSRLPCSYPLSITINGYVFPDFVSTMVSALLPHRARWGYLKLLVPLSTLPTINGPMPLLTHLDFALVNSEDVGALVFHDVPRLRTVVLDARVALRATLPWSRLTSLTLRYIVEPSVCIPILQQTSNLVHCTLYFWANHNLMKRHWSDITFPFLEKLTFTSIGGGLEFLDTFIVPGLRTLEVPERCLGSNPIDYLTSFISKSRCKLLKLHITDYRTFPEDLYHLAFALEIPELSFEGSIFNLISDEEYSEDEDKSGSSDGQGNSNTGSN
jgi:hypothetical protein